MRPKRKNFPKEAVRLLTRWLYTHTEFPYPDAQEAKALCRETSLSLKQLRIWFINNRKVRPKLALTLIQRKIQYKNTSHPLPPQRPASSTNSHAYDAMLHLSADNQLFCASSHLEEEDESTNSASPNHLPASSGPVGECGTFCLCEGTDSVAKEPI